jgi:hypothetical protein
MYRYLASALAYFSPKKLMERAKNTGKKLVDDYIWQ